MAPAAQRQSQEDNHEPPTSTIAAQILRTTGAAGAGAIGAGATTSHSFRNGPQRDVFDALLAEFLADPYVDTAEDKLDDNARFITFLVEAAGEARARQLREQPFALGAVEKQASDCLRAVRLTLEQQPDLLLWNGVDTRKNGEKPPFVCWIVAKVLAVGAREKEGEVWDNAVDVLVVCERSLQARPALWQVSMQIGRLLRSTADALLGSFKGFGKMANLDPSEGNFGVAVPAAGAISDLWKTTNHQLVALPQGYQTVLKKPNDAASMLLLILCTAIERSSPQCSGMGAYWILDTCTRLLQSYRRLAKQRCLDRRRIVVRLVQILTALRPSLYRAHEIQQATDILAELILLVTPSIGEASQSAIATLLTGFVEHNLTCKHHLLAACSTIRKSDERWTNILFALQRAIETAIDAINIPDLTRISQGEESKASDSAQPSNKGSDVRVNGNHEQSNGKRPFEVEVDAEEHPSKRVKSHETIEPAVDQYQRLVNDVQTFIDTDKYDLAGGLKEISLAAIDMLNESQIDKVFNIMRLMPCAGQNNLMVNRSDRRNWQSCDICDVSQTTSDVSTTSDHGKFTADEAATFRRILIIIMSLPSLKSRKLRVILAQVIGRFANHTSKSDLVDLASCPLGRWCMRSIQSSFRELRIAATQALMPYLRSSLGDEIMHRNRGIVLELLSKLGEKDNLAIRDTLLGTWGLIGRFCGETELNIALIELVNALGHGHMIICATAYQELRQLAKHLKKSTMELFTPFWRSVAPEIVKDVISCPQKAQQMSELLQLRAGIDELLVITQMETVPYLVLTKRHDVLARLVQARPDIDAVESLIMQPRRNLASVIAKLLLEFGSESAAAALLQYAAPILKGKFAELIQVDPVRTMCELLKSTVDYGDSAQDKSVKAFELVATISMSEDVDGTKRQRITAFLEEYVLGIMAHFTDIVDNSKDRQSLSEKRRAIKAIEELIKRSGVQIELALPQVRATLHSALEDPDLVGQAFSAWLTLMDCVTPDKFQSYVPYSFAIVVQKWSAFDSATQTRAHKMITHLVERNNKLINDDLASMPSLAGIALFQKLESDLASRKEALDVGKYLDAFTARCGSDAGIVVRQALRELVPYLTGRQSQILESKAEAIPRLYRALLDTSLRFKEHDDEVVDLCAQGLGLLGCVDPNNLESICPKHNLMVLSNFERVSEVVEFITHMLKEVLVPAFQAAPTGKQQSYLAYVMQELLRLSGITDALNTRARGSTPRQAAQTWYKLPESTQYILAPYLSSKYALTNPAVPTDLFPFMPSGTTPPHAVWLRNFVFNFLHRAKGSTASAIFPKISRVIQGHDLSISSFMLPFVVQNVIADGSDDELNFVTGEMASIMQYDISKCSDEDKENVKKASENVFEIFDYLSRWVHEKNEMLAKFSNRSRGVALPDDFNAEKETLQVSKAQKVLDSVNPWVMATRAAQCGLNARAIYHNEQHIRQVAGKGVEEDYKDLQAIYELIDEPDGIDGISSKLKLLDVSQQVLDHKQAGRWAAALSYYEIEAQKNPNDAQLQLDLMQCLSASGQYDSVIKTFESVSKTSPAIAAICRREAVDAAWTTGKWSTLEKLLSADDAASSQDWDIGVGQALLALHRGDKQAFKDRIASLRAGVSRSMTRSTIMSLSSSHEQLLRLHILCELEAMSDFGASGTTNKAIVYALGERLNRIGSFTEDKQYVLGLRRAVMELSKPLAAKFTDRDVSATWLTSSRLARKANQITSAYSSVMHATDLNDPAATIEHARLLWKSGNIRKAIQNLRSAINDGSFATSFEESVTEQSIVVTGAAASRNKASAQNMLLAKTQLLLAKWMDIGGQEKSIDVLKFYKNSTDIYNKWDKGHYFLGSYYNKILESEKAAPANRQSEAYLTGECAKLTIDNYLRSMLFGPKYLYRTLPKVLTLWLDFGQDMHNRQKEAGAQKAGRGKQKPIEMDKHQASRLKMLELINVQVEKYLLKRTPTYISFTAYAQMLSRIDNPMPQVHKLLRDLITYITAAHPRQALWSLLAVSRSQSSVKFTPARAILLAVQQKQHDSVHLKQLVRSAETLTECLLDVCKQHLDAKGQMSLQKDVKFRRRLDEPCDIVIPFQKTLQATLASVPGVQAMRKNVAFPHEGITIAGFVDEVMVLSSLQRPRKLIIRGADGNKYPILCKPKDDLRKDQRLMEFNAMIDRALKRDVDAAKRKLYIKTYAVTTLNDEHGVLEWVDGLKPLRDIILGILRRQNVAINFNEIRSLLDRGCVDTANTGYKIFTDKILPAFPPVLYKWFLESFLEPEDWFNSRLRYTRSCAVMSIVGHALGLGDRHGENISLEQGTGGVFHVDFNCLFEKGLTFDKPELVPFRLTHNMVDAFGVYGYEGPFRRAAEITQRILKQYEDTLMTIMESFIYDPTTDFGLAPRGHRILGVPETPAEVLQNVKSKFNCMLRGETVPLSGEGYVDALIRMAVDPRNLVQMYVGWCAFL